MPRPCPPGGGRPVPGPGPLGVHRRQVHRGRACSRPRGRWWRPGAGPRVPPLPSPARTSRSSRPRPGGGAGEGRKSWSRSPPPARGEVRLLLTREGRVVAGPPLRLPAGGARETPGVRRSRGPAPGRGLPVLRLEPLPGTPDDDPSNDRLCGRAPGRPHRSDRLGRPRGPRLEPSGGRPSGSGTPPRWSRASCRPRTPSSSPASPGPGSARSAPATSSGSWPVAGGSSSSGARGRGRPGGGRDPRSRGICPAPHPVPPTPGLALAVALDRSGSTRRGRCAPGRRRPRAGPRPAARGAARRAAVLRRARPVPAPLPAGSGANPGDPGVALGGGLPWRSPSVGLSPEAGPTSRRRSSPPPGWPPAPRPVTGGSSC